jgi:hypothetical protein
MLLDSALLYVRCQGIANKTGKKLIYLASDALAKLEVFRAINKRREKSGGT